MLPLLYPKNFENSKFFFKNQSKFDEENLSQNNFFTPKSQDLPSSIIQFNSSETINRSYSNVEPNSEELSFETPIEYDSFSADIAFNVINETLDIIEDAPLTYSRNQQAQSFIIGKTVNLIGFSISLYTKAEIYPHMEIRNNSYSGELIYAFTPLFISGASDSGVWINITFSEHIILTPGTYFLWIEKILPADSSWEKSSDNNTETWEFTTSWQPANYDLTLKVRTSEIINPEDVEMNVNGIPVLNTGIGKGFVRITDEISSTNTILTINSNESISFFYSLASIFYRNCSIQYYTQIQQDLIEIEWNLTINSGYFSSPYSNYRINVSGIKDDYIFIEVHNQSSIVGYSSISPEVISFTAEATHILLISENYIDSVNLKDILLVGTTTTVNVSTKGNGDIYLFLWDNETLVYQNSSYNVSYQSFQWHLDPLIDTNSLNVEIFFNGSNEIGYYSRNISINRVSEIISDPIYGYALDNFSFSCFYRDFHSQLPISDGLISYNFGDLSGVMDMDTKGNYSHSIDLSQFSIFPGNYSISIQAEKENYGIVYSEVPIIINPRIVTMELSKSRTTIPPGNTIEFELNLKDIGNQSYLLRPVDIQIRVFHTGIRSNVDLVYHEILEGINQEESFSWKTPSDIEEGSYDIVIEVISEYYTGILTLDQAIEVKNSIFWLITLPIFIGLVSSIVGGYFVTREKVKRSLLGLMILHDNGAPLAEKISYKMKHSDSALVSGAFIGILSLIKEITGSRLRTIEIEGGYVNIIHGNPFWLILFMKDNPRWIEKGILKLKDEIQFDFGEKIKEFKGKPLDFPLHEMIKKYFNTEIITESPIKDEKLKIPI
ncbi:hypothetical protein DSAG12_03706 [Promethearchaeum syntrophicum]|uniref:Uncharacterized protein n=1 Tax=Promethearchaeum syntrophicum TaxID=2594042 RepID=A0A5B9DF15_9ARCH|nr:hypothetical protein [Candidatus Prometheoarchaeum syntrophicum]QEE17868.1 hypothetical protein DSAG12_03706 [Candidatus Prometheoarchaeum syntrophicum]